jgi:hypothetical protein
MRQDVEMRQEARMREEAMSDYGDITSPPSYPPRSSSLAVADDDEYKIRAERVKEGIKRRLSQSSQSEEMARVEEPITPAAAKKSLLQRIRMPGRRSTPEAAPSHMTTAPAPVHMAPKASAILMSPRMGQTAPASRLRTKNTGFFSRKHASAGEEEDRDFVPRSPPKVPAGAAASLGRRPPGSPFSSFTSITRSHSLKYIDHSIPPTPPSKDTPPDEKARNVEHTNAAPFSAGTPTPTVTFLGGDDYESPSKNGAYAQLSIPRLVTQPSTHSLRASVVPDAMDPTTFSEMKSRISGLGLEGFSLPSETQRGGGTSSWEYSPSVYSPEWRNAPEMQAFMSSERPRQGSTATTSTSGTLMFVYPDLANDPSYSNVSRPETPTRNLPEMEQKASITPFESTTPRLRRASMGMVYGELGSMYDEEEAEYDDGYTDQTDEDETLTLPTTAQNVINSPMSQFSAQPSPLVSRPSDATPFIPVSTQSAANSTTSQLVARPPAQAVSRPPAFDAAGLQILEPSVYTPPAPVRRAPKTPVATTPPSIQVSRQRVSPMGSEQISGSPYMPTPVRAMHRDNALNTLAPIGSKQSGKLPCNEPLPSTRGMQYDSGIDVDPAKTSSRSAAPITPVQHGKLNTELFTKSPSAYSPADIALAAAQARESTMQEMVETIKADNRRLDQRLMSTEKAKKEQELVDQRLASDAKQRIAQLEADRQLKKSKSPASGEQNRRLSSGSRRIREQYESPVAARQGKKALKDHKRVSTRFAKNFYTQHVSPTEGALSDEGSVTPTATLVAAKPAAPDEEPLVDLISRDITPQSSHTAAALTPKVSTDYIIPPGTILTTSQVGVDANVINGLMNVIKRQEEMMREMMTQMHEMRMGIRKDKGA